MLYIAEYKKRSRSIRERQQLKMGIKSQAFSFSKFEKAYLCCIKIDNSLTNHTLLHNVGLSNMLDSIAMKEIVGRAIL